MTPTTSLPAGTLGSDLDFSDDLDGVNGRIAFHEARLSLARSEPVEDLAQANLLLFALAASHSFDEVEEQVHARTGLWYDVTRQAAAPSPAAAGPPPVTSPPLPSRTGPTPPALPSVPAIGYRRLAQAFAAEQPASQPTTAAPSSGDATGIFRLARAYVGAQPVQTEASSPTPRVPASTVEASPQSGLTGISRIAASYAQTAKNSPATN